jgi:hypothetical protein
MPMKTIVIYSSILISLFFIACKSETTDKKEPVKLNEVNTRVLIAGNEAIKVADSIMYIANVKNPDPEEAYYMDKWLSGVKVQKLAELIFSAVYDGKLKAYDYMTGEEISIDSVKSMENEFKREDIGQILFTEDWYFDSESLKMYKQVNSVMLAYFRYADDGSLVGNKAGIRVYFNDTKPMLGAKDY